MIVLYVLIGLISFVIGLCLLILTFKFLIEGINYFRLASKKIKYELNIEDTDPIKVKIEQFNSEK